MTLLPLMPMMDVWNGVKLTGVEARQEVALEVVLEVVLEAVLEAVLGEVLEVKTFRDLGAKMRFIRIAVVTAPVPIFMCLVADSC